MKIAICDDNQTELQQLIKLLNDYKLRHPSVEFAIDSFNSIEEFGDKTKQNYDLMFLDILMPGISGIAFAKALRTSGVFTPIIFTTLSRDFALEAFEVDALQYLIKPVDYAALSDAIDKLLLTAERQKAGSIIVSSQTGVKNLYFHNIVYVECSRHLAFFHMSDNTTVRSKTLRQSFVSLIKPILADDRFVRTHHSYLINKDFVVKLNQHDFEVYGGHIVPIAKDKLSEVKNAYINYLDSQKEIVDFG